MCISGNSYEVNLHISRQYTPLRMCAQSEEEVRLNAYKKEQSFIMNRCDIHNKAVFRQT